MNLSRTVFVFLFGSLLYPVVTKAGSELETEKAEKVFSGFFHAMDKAHESGLPDAALQKRLLPFFSKDLSKILQQTSRRQAECLAVNSRINADILKHAKPGEVPATLKPPVFEGSIFTMQYEAPDAYSMIQSDLLEENTMSLVVEYGRHDDAADTYHWKSRVLLVVENGQWKIDNFIGMPSSNATSEAPENVKSTLLEFPSCTHDYENYEKDNSYRH